jgi:hypothetical protein
VPLLVRAPWMNAPAREGLFDSMAASATVLHALDVKPHPAFEGRSVFAGGKDIVVSESCGSGNADARLELVQLFDLANDPDELVDVANRAESKPVVDGLVGALARERARLFALRGADPAGWQAPAAKAA